MRNKGFTLLELLISLTIMAMIVALCFGAFHTGIRSWEKGEKKVIANQRLRIIPTLLKRQLASLALPDVLRKGRKYFYFSGTAKTVNFFSRISLHPRDDGIFFVSYKVEQQADQQENLGFYEQDIKRLPTNKIEQLEDIPLNNLLKNYKSINFAFLAHPGKDNNNEQVWLPEWEPETQTGVPRAVRLTLCRDSRDEPVHVVIPLPAGQDS